jgi:hypothetical protein
MRTAASFLAFVLLSCQTGLGQPEATRDGTDEGVPYTLTEQGLAGVELGIDGVGAPHGIGCLWPTAERTHHLELRLKVEDRPEIALRKVEGAGDEAALQASVDAVQVDVSPDRQHLAWSAGGAWTVYELLPVGRPFRTTQSGSGPEWARLQSAEQAALSSLAGEPGSERNAEVWEAIGQQPYGPPWDQVVLDHWPEVGAARELAVARGRPGSGVSAGWRALAEAEAAGALLGHEHEAALDLLFAMEEPVYRADELLLAAWPDDHDVLLERLRRPIPPSPDWTGRAVGGARARYADPAARSRGADLLLHIDLEAYASEALAVLLAAWPADADAVQMLEDHAGDVPDATCPQATAAVLGSWAAPAANRLARALLERDRCTGEVLGAISPLWPEGATHALWVEFGYRAPDGARATLRARAQAVPAGDPNWDRAQELLARVGG